MKFTINDSKLNRIITLVQVIHPGETEATITDFILADWNEGREHQDWLDTASAQDIADWVCGPL